MKANPLNKLIGIWTGNKGMDIAPEDGGQEENPYYETLTIEPVDIEIENADEQNLLAVRYHQVVTEIADEEVSHDESGYWIWDKDKNTIMNSFSIPRGICVLAGGTHKEPTENKLSIEVSANLDDPDWGITQSPFMKQKARLLAFTRSLSIDGDVLVYNQESTVDIYGKVFKHTDSNTLSRI